MLTTQFFALKIQRYMHEYGITADAGQGGRQGLRERGPQPQRLAAQALTEEEIVAAPMM